MVFKKIIMGGKVYTYPTDINEWKLKDESLWDGFKFSIVDDLDRNVLHNESHYSFLIEKEEKDVKGISCLVDLLSEFCEIKDTHELNQNQLFKFIGRISSGLVSSYRSWNVIINGNRAPSYFHIPEEMERFLKFYTDESISKEKRVILGHLLFELIHPFQDCNGRIGRALMFMLAQCPISEYIFNNLDTYYSLMNSNEGIDLDEWVKFIQKGY